MNISEHCSLLQADEAAADRRVCFQAVAGADHPTVDGLRLRQRLRGNTHHLRHTLSYH